MAVNHQLTTTRTVGQGVGFERTARITGYLVGSLDRFNNAKRSEERDRVKHGVGKTDCLCDMWAKTEEEVA